MWKGKMSSKAPFVGSPLTSGEGKAEPLKHSTGRTAIGELMLLIMFKLQ